MPIFKMSSLQENKSKWIACRQMIVDKKIELRQSSFDDIKGACLFVSMDQNTCIEVKLSIENDWKGLTPPEHPLIFARTNRYGRICSPENLYIHHKKWGLCRQ